MNLLLLFLHLGTSAMTSSVASTVFLSDFKVQQYHGSKNDSGLWQFEIFPPANHHFNIEAPNQAKAGAVKFETIEKSEQKIVYQKKDASLVSGSTVEVSAYVCDEKKTYCLKKVMGVVLDEKNAKKMGESVKTRESKPVTQESKTAPTQLSSSSDGFIHQDAKLAIDEAKKTGKPLLIDFYGIWCPPCNLYNETIFHTKEFAKQAKAFVLLKMDADDEKSWDLKSQFKIGGYPTIVIANLLTDSKAESFDEVSRIVGYFPPKEFYSKLKSALELRKLPLEKRWQGRLEELLALKIEQKDYASVIELAKNSKQASILLYRFIAETKKDADFLKNEKNVAEVKSTLDSLLKDSQKVASDVLIRAADFLNSEFWLGQEKYFAMANELLVILKKRIDPQTLFVKGTEITNGDLDALRMEIAESIADAKKKESTVAAIRKEAIKNYEKLIALYQKQAGKMDLRSLNLEYAYLLWNDGRSVEAKKIYDRFIAKYPAEFTFYYAAGRMYEGVEDHAKAREHYEKAYEFSYGDNKIRAMERLVNVMRKQGLKKEAVARGKEFLKNVKKPQNEDVRTGRYLDMLSAAIKKAEG